MISGFEAQIGKAVGAAAKVFGVRLKKRRERKKMVDGLRTAMPRRDAVALLGELSGDQAVTLSRLLTSPNFEQFALQYLAATVLPTGERERLTATVRDEIRDTLRHSVAPPADTLLPLTDLVLDGLRLACDEAVVKHEPRTRDILVTAAHLAPAAARNGELLRDVVSLAAFHEAATLMRSQVAAAHGHIRLRHTGVSRAVPWERLHVEPRLEDDHGPLAIAHLIGPAARNVILGDPGAGKSTLTAKLAHDIATDPADPRVPFRVVLRDLSERLQTGGLRLAEHIRTVARDPYNVDLTERDLEYLLLNGRAVVLLDGLDELTDVALRSRVTDLVESFACRYPTVPILVTSRSIGYGEAPLRADLFPAGHLRELEGDDVEQYASHWFDLDDSLLPEERAGLAERFMDESHSIHDLRANPLLLSLLCAMYASEQYIPRNRSEIYERCARMVYERWDSMRGIRLPLQFQGRVSDAVQELAWHLFREGGNAELPRREALRVLVAFLKAQGFDRPEAESTASDFLAFCTGRAWVLAEVGSTETEPIYGFAHRTFMEYFAAERLVRHNPTPKRLARALKPHLDLGAWSELVELALQLIERGHVHGADRTLALLLKTHGPLDESSAFIAGRASGAVSLSPVLLRELVDRLIEVIEDHTEDARLSDYGSWADTGLTNLLWSSLEANRTPLWNHVMKRIGELALNGRFMTYLVLHDLEGHPLGPSTSLAPGERAAIDAWIACRPWAVYYFGSAPYDVASQGIAALYQHIGRGDHGISTRRDPAVIEQLLTLPTPWISRAEWLRVEPMRTVTDPAVLDEEFGHKLLLTLPVLEQYPNPPAQLSWDNVALDFHAVRHGIVPALPWVHPHIPAHIWDFLIRWANREFSVLG